MSLRSIRSKALGFDFRHAQKGYAFTLATWNPSQKASEATVAPQSLPKFRQRLEE